MKQSFARQHSRHRDHTPSVIYLPPPKPPVTAKRSIAALPDTPVEAGAPADAAIALPDAPEPRLSERADAYAPSTPGLSRQARRKAARAEAKALRRQGHAPAPIAAAASTIVAEPAPAPEIPATVEPEIAAVPIPPTAALPFAAPEAARPLPRARSIVAAKPRGLALFVQRLRGFFIVKRPRAVPAKGAGDAAIAGQLRTLRDELAALQQSVDRMLDGVAA